MRTWDGDTLVGLRAKGEGNWAWRHDGANGVDYWAIDPFDGFFGYGAQWVHIFGAGRGYAQSRLFWEDRA